MSWTDYSNTEANAWDANAPSINSSYEKNEIAFDTRVPQEQGSVIRIERLKKAFHASSRRRALSVRLLMLSSSSSRVPGVPGDK